MSIVDDVAELNERRVVAAAARYRDLVLRSATPKPSDSTELLTVMNQLHLSEDDLREDIRAVATVAELQGELLSKDALAKISKNASDRTSTVRTQFIELISMMLQLADLRELHAIYRTCWISITNLPATKRESMSFLEDQLLREYGAAESDKAQASITNERTRNRISEITAGTPRIWPDAQPGRPGIDLSIYPSRLSGR